MTTQSRHLHRLLTLFDPLLSRAPLVVEAHYRSARSLQVGHDESDSGEQLSEVELHFRHHTPRRLPARGLVEEALVPHNWFVSRTTRRSSQQLFNITHQTVVGRNPNRVLRPT